MTQFNALVEARCFVHLLFRPLPFLTLRPPSMHGVTEASFTAQCVVEPSSGIVYFVAVGRAHTHTHTHNHTYSFVVHICVHTCAFFVRRPSFSSPLACSLSPGVPHK